MKINVAKTMAQQIDDALITQQARGLRPLSISLNPGELADLRAQPDSGLVSMVSIPGLTPAYFFRKLPILVDEYV